jgi:hypothetical protein
MQHCNDEPKLRWRRSKKTVAARSQKTKCVALHGLRSARDRHGAGSSRMHPDGGPRLAKRCPGRYQRPDLTGFSRKFLRTRPVARKPNFGNSANELQFAIEACRTSAGFCYE